MLLDEEEDTREDAVRAFWSALFEPMLNESRQFDAHSYALLYSPEAPLSAPRQSPEVVEIS